MPPRRRNPSTPRSSRRRMSIPELDVNTRSRSAAYENIVLRAVEARNEAAGRAAQQATAAHPAEAEAEDNFSVRTRRAIEFAREGDDAILMPYQPTPSTNTARPRTRAVGYDPKTETMWVRYRESKKYPNGAVYAYYDVPRNQWKNIKRVNSPGRFLDRNIIDRYPATKTDI